MNEMNPSFGGMNQPSVNPGVPVEDFSSRCQKILAVAKQLFQGNPDWVTFFREVLGVDGAARSVFPSQADFIAFEKSPEFVEIQNLVSALRNRKVATSAINEPTRVITVRLPESLHEALKAEANDHNTSMNKLCISKLLQVLVDNPKNQTVLNRGTTAAHPQMPQPTSSTNFRSTYTPASTAAATGGNSGQSAGGFRTPGT